MFYIFVKPQPFNTIVHCVNMSYVLECSRDESIVVMYCTIFMYM